MCGTVHVQARVLLPLTDTTIVYFLSAASVDNVNLKMLSKRSVPCCAPQAGRGGCQAVNY